MTLSAPTFTCTDRMGRVILSGMEEIIGRDEIFSILKQSATAEIVKTDMILKRDLDFSFKMLPELQANIEKIYGISAGRGLAIRSGRACFRYILREFGAELGLTNLEYRLLSLPARLKFSNQSLAALINKHSGQRVEFGMDDQYLRWTIERNPAKASVHNEKSACYLIFGLLQEMLSWTSGGKIYKMEQTHCTERGDKCCEIQISKTPIN